MLCVRTKSSECLMFEDGTEEQYFQCNYIVYMSNFWSQKKLMLRAGK